MIVMEGPAFSTKAESLLYRSWGAHVIGMTALPEAKLAREAGICYATLACVTDYDTWHDGHDTVTADVRVRINVIGWSMCGPAGVTYSAVPGRRVFSRELFEFSDATGPFANLQTAATGGCDPSAVVATVF